MRPIFSKTKISRENAQLDAWESKSLDLKDYKSTKSAQDKISLEQIVNDELEAA